MKCQKCQNHKKKNQPFPENIFNKIAIFPKRTDLKKIKYIFGF